MGTPSVYSLTGNDTVVIGGRVLNNFADGDNGKITFAHDIAAVKTGKNANAIFAENKMGLQCEMELRIIRAAPDDVFLNGLLSSQLADFSAFDVLDGQFVKRVGDGSGNITNDSYILNGGIFQRQVDAKQNAEGDTEQSLSIWRLIFAEAERAQL